MSNKPFIYQEPFPMGKDNTEYYLLTSDYVSVAEFDGETILKVEPEALTMLAQQAFHDASFMLRPAHQKQVAAILHDPEASENDKYVALQFLRNSEIAAKGVLPTCQIRAPRSSSVKRSASLDRMVAMKKRCRKVSITLISKITCVTHKTRRWICTKRSTPARTCLHKSTCTR